MESGMVLCVRSSSRSQWIPVPMEKRGRELSVVICSQQRWLHKVLVAGQKGRDALDASLVIKAFEQHVRAHVGPPTPDRVSAKCSGSKRKSACWIPMMKETRPDPLKRNRLAAQKANQANQKTAPWQ